MEKTQLLFDYIFYRTYKFSKDRGDIAPSTNGTLLVSLMQFFTLLDIVVFVRMIFPFPLPTKILILPFLALPVIINWLRYERKFDPQKLDNRWRDEKRKNKTRNGVLIVTYLLISILIPVVHGYLELNLNASKI